MTLEQFFDGKVEPGKLFEAVAREVALVGKASIRVTKSQIAFRRRKNLELRQEMAARRVDA